MADKAEREVLTIDGCEVAISNPRKVLFPEAGYTKLDLVRYYLAVADGALRGTSSSAVRPDGNCSATTSIQGGRACGARF